MFGSARVRAGLIGVGAVGDVEGAVGQLRGERVAHHGEARREFLIWTVKLRMRYGLMLVVPYGQRMLRPGGRVRKRDALSRRGRAEVRPGTAAGACASVTVSDLSFGRRFVTQGNEVRRITQPKAGSRP